MTIFKVTRAYGRGVLNFEFEPTFDPVAPGPVNELWRRAIQQGHLDRDDYNKGVAERLYETDEPLVRL